MHSEISTSDVLSCGSGFKVHGVQVGHFHLVVLSSKDFHSGIFSCCVEWAGTLVSVHNQNSLCWKNPRVLVKMTERQDEEKLCLVRSYNLFSFRTAGCITERQNVKLTHRDVHWKTPWLMWWSKGLLISNRPPDGVFIHPWWWRSQQLSISNQAHGLINWQLSISTQDSALSEHVYLSDRLRSCV